MSDLVILHCREQRDTSGPVPGEKSVFMNARISKCKLSGDLVRYKVQERFYNDEVSLLRLVFQSVLAERKRLKKCNA